MFIYVLQIDGLAHSSFVYRAMMVEVTIYLGGYQIHWARALLQLVHLLYTYYTYDCSVFYSCVRAHVALFVGVL